MVGLWSGNGSRRMSCNKAMTGESLFWVKTGAWKEGTAKYTTGLAV